MDSVEVLKTRQNIDIHMLSRRPLINRFTLSVSSFVSCPFLDAEETMNSLTKQEKIYDIQDIIRGQSIDFRTANHNSSNAFGEDSIRRGYMAAIG